MKDAMQRALLLWLTTAVPGGAAQVAVEESCPGVITAPPNLAVCFGPGVAGGEVGWLGGITCALSRVEDFQLQQLSCLQRGIKRIETLRNYPEALLEPLVPIRNVVKEIATLRQQVSDLSCGGRFSAMPGLLRTCYLAPMQLRKPS